MTGNDKIIAWFVLAVIMGAAHTALNSKMGFYGGFFWSTVGWWAVDALRWLRGVLCK